MSEQEPSALQKKPDDKKEELTAIPSIRKQLAYQFEKKFQSTFQGDGKAKLDSLRKILDSSVVEDAIKKQEGQEKLINEGP